MAIRAHRIRSFIAAVVAVVLGIAVIGFLGVAMGWEVPIISDIARAIGLT